MCVIVIFIVTIEVMGVRAVRVVPPSGGYQYYSSSCLSHNADSPPTEGMWPRNRTPSYNNTPFKQSTEERKPGPGGVSLTLAFSPQRATYCQCFAKRHVCLNPRVCTSGGAAAPGCCLHPLELHSGFCLRYASELAWPVSIGCLVVGSAGSGKTKWNVCLSSKSALVF